VGRQLAEALAGGHVKVAHLDTGRTWRGGQAQALLLMRELRARGVSQLLLSPPGPLADRALADGFERERWRPRASWTCSPWPRALDPQALRAGRGALSQRSCTRHRRAGRALGGGARRGGVAPRRLPRAHERSQPLKYALPVDRYLCISEGVRAAMIASGVTAARLSLVPSGVDLAEVRAAASRRTRR
jgi:hypothetical protein